MFLQVFLQSSLSSSHFTYPSPLLWRLLRLFILIIGSESGIVRIRQYFSLYLFCFLVHRHYCCIGPVHHLFDRECFVLLFLLFVLQMLEVGHFALILRLQNVPLYQFFYTGFINWLFIYFMRRCCYQFSFRGNCYHWVIDLKLTRAELNSAKTL